MSSTVLPDRHERIRCRLRRGSFEMMAPSRGFRPAAPHRRLSLSLPHKPSTSVETIRGHTNGVMDEERELRPLGRVAWHRFLLHQQ